MVKTKSAYRRVDVISPQPRVSVALVRLIRATMTPQVHCDESMAVGQIRAELPTPGEPTL